jgi:alkyl sulfatase BDS1-like metallo-beta-lactamase superfamily hydrolase
LRIAQKAFDAGEYRWAAMVLNHLVFADPAGDKARDLLARTHAQMAYQAESAIWRNMFLVSARELREGPPPAAGSTVAIDLIRNTPTPMLLDLFAVRLDPDKIGDAKLTLNLVFPERKEMFLVTIANSVLVHQAGLSEPGATTLTAPRSVFLETALGGKALAEAIAAGKANLAGDPGVLRQFFGAFTAPDPAFPIVTP